MPDDNLFCVVTYYSETDRHANTLPLPYKEAQQAWLQATDQGRKFVLKTHGCWVKIEPTDQAPPYREPTSGRIRNRKK